MKKITDPNLAMKLIIVGLKSNPIHKLKVVDLMLDYRWEVFEDPEESHDYHIIGCHPIAKRIDLFLTKTVIH